MRRTTASLALAMSATLALAACQGEEEPVIVEAGEDVPDDAFETDRESGEEIADTSAGSDREKLVIELAMTGDAEVPGPGADLDGPLVLELTLRTASDDDPAEACIRTFSAADVGFSDLPGELTGLHVHSGAAGESGSVVLDLSAILDSIDQDAEVICTDVGDVAPILDDLPGHYLNLHTSEFPDGAVRAQMVGGTVGEPDGGAAEE